MMRMKSSLMGNCLFLNRLFRIVTSLKNLSYNVKKILGGFLLKDYIEERAINIAN